MTWNGHGIHINFDDKLPWICDDVKLHKISMRILVVFFTGPVASIFYLCRGKDYEYLLL